MRKSFALLTFFLTLGLQAQQGFVRNDGQWEDPSSLFIVLGRIPCF
jgi:hypothetical protein